MAAVSRADVWLAFAEHFLDTETRHAIPDAAYTALAHGLTPATALDVWCFEVTPVLYHNLWSVAGDWAGWDREWLTASILAKRGRWPNRPGPLGRAVYKLRIDGSHGTWLAIAHCMETLEAAPPADRARVAAELVWLGRHFFDFAPTPRPAGWDREVLGRLFASRFLPGFLPLVYENERDGESQAKCAARVQAALDA